VRGNARRSGINLIRLPEPDTSPLRSLSYRVLLAIALLTALVLLVYLDRDGYRDGNDPPGYTVGFVDAIYYSTVTMTTTGYGDITPVTDGARLVNALVVTPLRIGFLVLLVGTTLEVLATQGRQLWRVARWRKHMKDHVIVVGYGTKGRSAVAVLLRNGQPKEGILVVDPRSDAIEEAHANGLAAVAGDATRREVLRRAEVQTARQVIITTDRDDSNVLTTLTVRQLNTHAKVIVAVRENDNVMLARQSGADSVVTSSEAVGRLLGLSTVSPALGEVLEDLLTYGHGLEVAERPVQPRELGKPPQKLLDQVIGVIRDDQLFRYFDPAVSQLIHGDRLIVVRPAEETPWASRPGTQPTSG
jgi:voltage-gated potassium channel